MLVGQGPDALTYQVTRDLGSPEGAVRGDLRDPANGLGKGRLQGERILKVHVENVRVVLQLDVHGAIIHQPAEMCRLLHVAAVTVLDVKYNIAPGVPNATF